MEYIGIQKKNGGVVEALQQAILSGQIPAGTEMTQNELAEKSRCLSDAGAGGLDDS